MSGILRPKQCKPAETTVLRTAYHQMLAAVGQGELAILPSGPESEALRLTFPAERMPGVGRALAFDDVYGIVVAFARGRLFVMQY
jgi:hypothetical protein